VKLWPGIQTAESEVVARLKITAESLGLECIEIAPDGHRSEDAQPMAVVATDPKTRNKRQDHSRRSEHQPANRATAATKGAKVTKDEVDFAIHLHFETPKSYDLFSFAALWNPVQFFHEWGYARVSKHLLTHDDFLSCDSEGADDHLLRLIHGDSTRLPPHFKLYHSLSKPILEPTLGDLKLFYSGINWDRLGRGRSRHHELLEELDKTSSLRIYGPKVFQGVRIWSGFKSYVGEIPFDGTSMIHEIAKAGVLLCLSSTPHKEAALMSSRLFEGLAAGALIICDENPFGRRFFGDSLLYIDTRKPVAKIVADILGHLAWAKSNPEQGVALAKKSQQIFTFSFALDQCLRNIYQGFPARKLALQRQIVPPPPIQQRIHVNFLLPEYWRETLSRYLESIKTQDFRDFTANLIVDSGTLLKHGRKIRSAIANSPVPVTICEARYFERASSGKIMAERKLGEVLSEVIADLPKDSWTMFVAPNEELLANHIGLLVGSLLRNPDKRAASAGLLLRHKYDGKTFHDVHFDVDFTHQRANAPNGFSRFLFRVSSFPQQLDIALRHLDKKALAVLLADGQITREPRCTVVVDIQKEFPSRSGNEAAEISVIEDFDPGFFKRGPFATAAMLTRLEPYSLSLGQLLPDAKRRLASELIQALPIPKFLRPFLRAFYRLLKRAAS